MNSLMRALSVAVALLLGISLAACGGGSGNGNTGSSSGGSSLNTISAGTLTVCSDIPYPPFDVMNGDTFSGFDGELVSAISKGLNLKLTVKDSGFDGLQSGLSLNSNQCDLVASAMTITPEREKNLDFTDGYYDSEQSLLVPTSSTIASIDDLAGKKVGVQQGTTGKAFAEKNVPSSAEVISFPSDAEEYAAIQAGQVDALLQDLPVNLDHTKGGKFKIVQKFNTGEQYGFAVKQGNTALRDAVNQQLQKLRDNGTYKKIYDKYFSAS